MKLKNKGHYFICTILACFLILILLQFHSFTLGEYREQDSMQDLVLDSLPYADGEYDLSQAEAMVQQELQYDPFQSTEIPIPQPTTSINQTRFQMLAEDGIQNAKAQLEYQRSREVELELAEKYGKDQWLQYLKTLEAQLLNIKTITTKSEQEFSVINNRRMEAQVRLQLTARFVPKKFLMV